MATAGEVITDALENLVVQADEAPIEASEAKTAIRVLNQFMASLVGDGIELGYTEVSALSDLITVPDAALLPISTCLSLWLAPKYSVTDVSPALIRQSLTAVNTLYRLGVTIADSDYPSTLPVGSGNGFDSDCVFYPDEDSTILSEQNRSISLEDDTEEA